MDQSTAHERIRKNVDQAVAAHVNLLDTLFVTEGFPAEDFVDMYRGTVNDVLTPGNAKGVEKLKAFALLAEKLTAGTRYVAVVRVSTATTEEYGGLLPKTAGKQVERAYLRIFEDVTPDKVRVQQHYVMREVNNGEGASLAMVPEWGISIDSPSHLFTSGNIDTSYQFDDEMTLIEKANPNSRGFSVMDQRSEADYPYQLLYADTREELNGRLEAFGVSKEFPHGQLDPLLVGNAPYQAWQFAEDKK